MYTLEDSVSYEYQVVAHLARQPGRKVYHWLDVPESVLFDAGWFTDHASRRRQMLKSGKFLDLGLDAVAINPDGTYTGIQAKCYGETSTITTAKLGTFIVSTLCYLQEKNKNNKAILAHTPECRFEDDIRHTLDHVLSKRGFQTINIPFDHAMSIAVDEDNLELRQYQVEAIAALRASESLLKLIVLPCGSGKTEIVKHSLEGDSGIVVVASPLRYSAEQNLLRLALGLPDHEVVVAFSGKDDSCLDTKLLKQKVQSGKKLYIATTFASFGVVMECIGEKAARIVIDEAHNLADQNQLWGFMANRDTTLVTATPPSFMMEENPDIDLVYHYEFANAIKDGYILDYEIVIPDVTHTDNLIFENGDPGLCAKALFLISGMLEKGCKKTIVYLSGQEECRAFAEIFARAVRECFGLKATAGCITCDTSDNDRKMLINRFAAFSDDRELAILTSVRILDEAIDIPACDSVFFAQVADRVSDRASTRAVQRLCRANRILPNKNKATAFVWTGADGENDLTATFSVLKENDPRFQNKVSVISRDYDSKGTEEAKNLRDISWENVRDDLFDITYADKIWDSNYRLFLDYVSEKGDLPKHSDFYRERPIGHWIHNQRTFYAYKKLAQYRIEKLEEIPVWKWRVRNPKRNRIDDIVSFYNENKRVPNDKDVYGGSKICASLYKIRYRYNEGKLSASDIAKLEAVPGWEWKVRDRLNIDDFIARLTNFYEKENRRALPQKYEDYPLSDRAKYVRTLFRQGKLEEKYVTILKSFPLWTFTSKKN